MGWVQGESVEWTEADSIGAAQDVADQFVTNILGLGAVQEEGREPPVLLVWALVFGDLNEEGFVIRWGGGQEGKKMRGSFARGAVGGKSIAYGICSI